MPPLKFLSYLQGTPVPVQSDQFLGSLGFSDWLIYCSRIFASVCLIFSIINHLFPATTVFFSKLLSFTLMVPLTLILSWTGTFVWMAISINNWLERTCQLHQRHYCRQWQYKYININWRYYCRCHLQEWHEIAVLQLLMRILKAVPVSTHSA